MSTSSPDNRITVRNAVAADVPVLFSFICRAAELGESLASVSADEDRLRQTLFADPPYACVLLAGTDSSADRHWLPVGFATYYFKYSTYKAMPTLYIEDLFVSAESRGTGVGTALMRRMARIAFDHDCHSMEWVTPASESNAALGFYRRLGAEVADTIEHGKLHAMRLSPEAIKLLAKEDRTS